MRLQVLDHALTVCQVESLAGFNLDSAFYCIGKTAEELSLVCRTQDAPPRTLTREDGWRAFRVAGTLDFSLTGILAGLSRTLAEAGIGIFAVSTYDTDYFLVKQEHLARALDALRRAGHQID